jgi:Tfp pilus assembly protein PilF
VATPALPLWRKLAYAAVLTATALGALAGALEAVLRLAGFGESPHFARRVTLPGGETVWRDNRGCTVPFFSPALARRPQPFRLPEKKAPGAYRIFVLGSSAAMGDPESSFSLARTLEVMLHATWPQQRFEVVNAGVTAINSHLLRQYADDCARLEPDLFIVYEGHNEVIGPFGPAGVFAPFFHSERAIRFALWLKGTRTGQLFSAAGRVLAGRRGVPAEWGGMQMFLRQQIAADDPRLDAVGQHFRANLLAIADAGQHAGATTLLCTVLTNQRDFAPFLSQHRPNLAPADLARWQAGFAAAENAARQGDPAAAERAYRAAFALDDRYAEVPYRLGRLALAAGRDDEARGFFQRALDLDTLRFRTDSRLNGVIRDLDRGDRPDLAVVDLAGDLAARSPHGIPGDDLLYEHVHLTLRGTYEAARDLFPHVAADLRRRGLITSLPPAPPSYDDVRRRLAYTTYEQAMIALSLLGRFRAAPFTGLSDDAARGAAWERISATANELLARPDALPALREVYQQAMTLAPDDWILARNAGAMLVARRAPAEALPLLQRAAAWIDDDIDTLVALGWAQRALNQTAAADATFARARRLEPRYPGLPN